MSEDWGIVGGGMLGMTIALRLAQEGRHVTLLEAGDHLGGLADAWRLGPIEWDRHYHVILKSDTYLRALLVELGLDAEIHWSETKTGFFTDGRLHSLSNTLEFLQFPPLSLLDRLRLGWTIFYASKIRNWRRLERVRVTDWLARLSGRRVLERIWLPLLRAKLGENYRDTSAAFIWATIARLYAARRSGLKRELFGYVPGGYRRIHARLADALSRSGVSVELNSRVQSVKWAGNGVQVATPNGERSFDRVVLTAPSPLAAAICPQLRDEERARLRSIRYQGVVCVSVLLDEPLSAYYVTNITDPSIPFTAVVEMTALADRRMFGGKTLVYLPKYVPSESPDFESGDSEVIDQFLAGLEAMYPSFRRTRVEAARVSRARHVMAIPTLGYSGRVPPVQTSLPGISIVNSSQIVNATLNVNETIRQAEEAAGKLVSADVASRGVPGPHQTKSHAQADRQLVP